MKNLFGMVRKPLRSVFLIVAVFMAVFWVGSCNHNNPQTPKSEKITVTVKKDSHVTKAPSTFQLDKGSKLNLLELKGKLEGLTFEGGFELAKICIGDENGQRISKTEKYSFDKDETIFIASQTKSHNPTLTELKVDKSPIAVEDIMDVGIIGKDKVQIETTFSPEDAKIEFALALQDGFWQLAVGKNTLKITVRHASKEKEYALKIERVKDGVAIQKGKVCKLDLTCHF